MSAPMPPQDVDIGASVVIAEILLSPFLSTFRAPLIARRSSTTPCRAGERPNET